MAFADSTRNILNNMQLFRKTSSFNKYFICDYCGKTVRYRSVIIKHISSCSKRNDYTTCRWCNIKFKNRGNLVWHTLCIHGENSVKMTEEVAMDENDTGQQEITKEDPSVVMGPPLTTSVPKSALKPIKDNACSVCPLTFRTPDCLKYHIRSKHYNLKTKTMSYDDKEVNQVWHEKVFNTSNIVEIKKAAPNLFLIRKLEDNKQVTVQECSEYLDLSELYPTNKRSSLGKCKICLKTMLKRDLKKHYDERHMQIQKHTCNNCQKTFKRSVLFIRHICNKDRRRKLIL